MRTRTLLYSILVLVTVSIVVKIANSTPPPTTTPLPPPAFIHVSASSSITVGLTNRGDTYVLVGAGTSPSGLRWWRIPSPWEPYVPRKGPPPCPSPNEVKPLTDKDGNPVKGPQ